MIFFHGTQEANIKKIKKQGLLDVTNDQWIVEVTQRQVCCLSKQPTSGEGGNPSYFTHSNPQKRNQDGYLVVVRLPRTVFCQKVIAIFDNKVLDDYVRWHFFVREEFRYQGYALFERLKLYHRQDHAFQQLDQQIRRRDARSTDTLLNAPQDQRRYYKKLRPHRYMYDILGIEVTDELFDLTKQLGQWQGFYTFLELHFGGIDAEQYNRLVQQGPTSHQLYWQQFYQRFPLPINQPRQEYLRDWFAPQWLLQRQLPEITPNCQILSQHVEPRYILGFIKVNTPAGFAPPFRSCRAKGGFTRLVWQEVNKMLR